MTDPTTRTNMKLPPCSPANSILESDLVLAAHHGILSKLTVLESSEGFFVIAEFADISGVLEQKKGSGLPDWFYIIAQLLSEPDRQWYLTTRRERTTPKVFRDLNRLNEHLKESYPTTGFELLRNCSMPSEGTLEDLNSFYENRDKKLAKAIRDGEAKLKELRKQMAAQHTESEAEVVP